jgi:hypothetical protein
MADDAANAACGALTMAVADDWSSGRAFLELARREMREMELRSRGDTDESDTPKPILREWARGSVEWYVAQAAIARGEAPLLPAQHDEQPSAPRLIVAPPVYYRTAEEEALGFIYKHIRMPGY